MLCYRSSVTGHPETSGDGRRVARPRAAVSITSSWDSRSAIRSSGAPRAFDQSELHQGSYPIVQTDLLRDPAFFDSKYGRAGEPHLSAGRSRQRSRQEVTESRTRMRTATFPAADHIVAFGDQISRAPEIEVRESIAKVGHERLDVSPAAARLMQRVLQEHVGSRELVDDVEIAGFSPEIREPAAHDCLVVLLF